MRGRRDEGGGTQCRVDGIVRGPCRQVVGDRQRIGGQEVRDLFRDQPPRQGAVRRRIECQRGGRAVDAGDRCGRDTCPARDGVGLAGVQRKTRAAGHAAGRARLQRVRRRRRCRHQTAPPCAYAHRTRRSTHLRRTGVCAAWPRAATRRRTSWIRSPNVASRMPGMRRVSSSAVVNTPARAPTLPPPVSCASSPSCAAARCTQ